MHSAGVPTRFTALRDGMRVELTYVDPSREVLIGFDVDPGSTVHDCVERSGLYGLAPALRHARLRFAVFGCLVDPDESVTEGDRIEVLRPLEIDPKEARRSRARRASGTRPFKGAGGRFQAHRPRRRRLLSKS